MPITKRSIGAPCCGCKDLGSSSSESSSDSPPPPISCASLPCQIPARAIRLYYEASVNICTECEFVFGNWGCSKVEDVHWTQDVELTYYPVGSLSGWDRPCWLGRGESPEYQEATDPCVNCPDVKQRVGYWFGLWCDPEVSPTRWRLRMAVADKYTHNSDWNFNDCATWRDGPATLDYSYGGNPPPRSGSPWFWTLIGAIAPGETCECLDFDASLGAGTITYARIYDPAC